MGVHSAYSIQLFSLFTQDQFTGICSILVYTNVYTNEQKNHARITRTVIIIIKILKSLVVQHSRFVLERKD